MWFISHFFLLFDPLSVSIGLVISHATDSLSYSSLEERAQDLWGVKGITASNSS